MTYLLILVIHHYTNQGENLLYFTSSDEFQLEEIVRHRVHKK